MKIHNVRIGFATNSSSSHSILLNCKDAEDPDWSWQFGWQDFLLKSKAEKARYMLAQLYTNLTNAYYNQFNTIDDTRQLLMMAGDVVKSLGFDFMNDIQQELFSNDFWVDVGVDHQSVITLPTEYNSKKLSMEFFRDLFRHMMSDKIAISGGNDNDDKIDRDGISHPINTLHEGHRSSCRQDGEAWTLFNPIDGTRMTFNFNEI